MLFIQSVFVYQLEAFIPHTFNQSLQMHRFFKETEKGGKELALVGIIVVPSTFTHFIHIYALIQLKDHLYHSYVDYTCILYITYAEKNQIKLIKYHLLESNSITLISHFLIVPITFCFFNNFSSQFFCSFSLKFVSSSISIQIIQNFTCLKSIRCEAIFI